MSLHPVEQTADLSRHRKCVIVRSCSVFGKIYEHTKKLDTQPSAQSTRRSRVIPNVSKNCPLYVADPAACFRHTYPRPSPAPVTRIPSAESIKGLLQCGLVARLRKTGKFQALILKRILNVIHDGPRE